jgi:hypothetical protein
VQMSRSLRDFLSINLSFNNTNRLWPRLHIRANSARLCACNMRRRNQGLTIEGKLPFEDYASEVNIADLLKILVNRDVLSIEDYELLVMRGHIFPLSRSMNESNWMDIKVKLLEFLELSRISAPTTCLQYPRFVSGHAHAQTETQEPTQPSRH